MLEMSRKKPRSLWIRGSYLLKRLLLLFISRRLLAKFLLNTAWLSRRLAFEVVGSMYREEFHNSQSGIDERLLREVIKPSDSVLDVGCGHGRWARTCSAFARGVVGIDYSAASIAYAKQNAPANCRFIVGDVTRDLSGTFDVAILSHILEHIENPRTFLQSIPAKRFVIELPDFNAECLNRVRSELDVPFYSDADHVCEYTAESLRRELESAGLKVESLISRNGNLVAVSSH